MSKLPNKDNIEWQPLTSKIFNLWGSGAIYHNVNASSVQAIRIVCIERYLYAWGCSLFEVVFNEALTSEKRVFNEFTKDIHQNKKLLKFKDKFDDRKPAFGVIIPVAPRSGGLHIANVGLFQFF